MAVMAAAASAATTDLVARREDDAIDDDFDFHANEIKKSKRVELLNPFRERCRASEFSKRMESDLN